MTSENIIVDANVIFRALCGKSSRIRAAFEPPSSFAFFSPRFLFVEIFKHKDRIISTSGISEDECLSGLYTLLSRLNFFNESDIPIGTWKEAYRLCGDIDEKDTPYLALTLHLGGQLWTWDEELKSGLKTKNFTKFFEPF